MEFHLLQYAYASLSDFISFSDFEKNRSKFTILKTDDCHEKEFAEDDDIFVSEKAAAPQCLAVDIKIQLPFSTYDNFHNFIFSSFGQAFVCRKKTNIVKDMFCLVYFNHKTFK